MFDITACLPEEHNRIHGSQHWIQRSPDPPFVATWLNGLEGWLWIDINSTEFYDGYTGSYNKSGAEDAYSAGFRYIAPAILPTGRQAND